LQKSHTLIIFGEYSNIPELQKKKKREDLARNVLKRQIDMHFNLQRGLMCRNSIDPQTLAARAYEFSYLLDII